MKRLYLLFIAISIIATMYGQAPAGFNYQAVARNPQGQLITNTQLTIEIAILKGGVDGPLVYDETFSPTTNNFGLVNLNIGNGTVMSGTFADIDWGADTYFIKVWLNSTEMGTTQLLSVPYALHAKTAENLAGGITITAADIANWNSKQDSSTHIKPVIITAAVSDITHTSAICGGNVIADAGISVTTSGVCWSTEKNPTISDSTTTDGASAGIFTTEISGLKPGSTYYIRAYATSSAGTGYGITMSFRTIPQLPSISTIYVTSITDSSAISGGIITDDGGEPVLLRGVSWDMLGNPNIEFSSRTKDSTGIGSFKSFITGLYPGRKYYLKAYACNSLGCVSGQTISFTTLNDNQISDVDGNNYNTITIGTQIWMAENLKTTKYIDDTDIPLVEDAGAWSTLSTPSYCWYNNDKATYKATYGALYNWYTINSGKLCPSGWHVPSNAEWTILNGYLGVESIAGGKLKEAGLAHWQSPNTGATNETGFTALPGGCRFVDGTFDDVGSAGHWWSSTEFSSGNAWYRSMGYDGSGVYNHYDVERDGFSVRCLKD